MRYTKKQMFVGRAGLGFTIIELIVATAVFAVVLMVTVTGFFTIGQIFYRGTAATQTNATAVNIIDSVSADARAASFISPPQPTGTAPHMYYSCLGGVRYTYYLYNKVNLSSHDTVNNFGLLRDYPGVCGNPYGTGSVPYKDPVELLGSKMRVSGFVIAPNANSNGDLYSIGIRVAYGDDDYLQDPYSPVVTCNGSLSASRFCAVATVATSITKGY